MQAFRILLHALRQVFGSFQQALVMSVLPLMLGLAAGFGLFVIGALAHRQDGSVGGFLFTVFLILVLLMAWLAVRWHRFVLLDESRKLLAPPSRAAFWRYVGTLVLTLILMIPAMLVTIGVLYAVHQGGIPVLTFIVILVLSVLLYALTLVLGTALPGAAVGAHRPIGAAWRALKPAAGQSYC